MVESGAGRSNVEAEEYLGARARANAISAGIWSTFILSVAGFGYAAATWEEPNRLALSALFGAAVLVALIVAVLPREYLIRSALREQFFFWWSASYVAVIAGLAYFDGGAGSPMTLLFFSPLVFTALWAPRRRVMAMGLLVLIAYFGTDLAAGMTSLPTLAFYAACLASVALLCAWQAGDHQLQREELARVSRADSLTGCLNRRGFEERAAGELADALRRSRPLAIVLLDLDDFKAVNDAHGHATGDEILRSTVGRMVDLLRPIDAVARMGGDEFALLLPEIDHEQSLTVAGRVQSALAERAQASLGVASYPRHGSTLEALLAHADAELYTAKSGGSSTAAEAARATTELSWAAALAQAVDARMDGSREHSSQVSEYASAMAERLGWDERQVRMLRLAAMVHDIGKIAVPDHVLRKPGPLTESEFREIMRHPEAGERIISRIAGLEPIAPWIRHSHERIDGAGYPDHLSGERIPAASRLLLVADAFDAMAHDRPYKRGLTLEQALAELRANAGTQFDRRCVELLEGYLAEQAEADAAGEAGASRSQGDLPAP